MATGGSESASDEIVNNKCSVCAEKSITREAEKYCIECKDYYCIPCTDMHKMFPAMKRHTLLDKADFSSTKQKVSLPSFPTEICQRHKGRVLEMYCKNHDEVVCSTCVALNHRACQDILSVPDEVDSLYVHSIELNETTKNLTTTKISMDTIKKTKESLYSQLKSYRDKAIEYIKDYRREIEDELKKLETGSILQVEKEFKSIEGKLQEQIKDVAECTVYLEQSDKKLNNLGENKAQEFVCLKVAQKNISEAQHKHKTLKEPEHVEIDFQIDPTLKIFVKQLKTFGKVSERAATLKSRAYEVNQQTAINVKSVFERDCTIHGCCFTENGSLLLSDHSNKKLKRVDLSSASVKENISLIDSPIAVCQISKLEVAVSLSNSTVQFVSLGKKMSATRQLKLEHECFGLAYKDHKLFISDGISALYIHDLSGKMINKIATDKSGNQIFSDNRHITSSASEDRVYAVDVKKGLITLDCDGNYKSTFTDPDVVSPVGVCTDGEGSVFVCGWGSSNLVQISEKSGSKLRVLEKVKDSLSACFDPQNNRLVVTYCGNSVHIYDLKESKICLSAPKI